MDKLRDIIKGILWWVFYKYVVFRPRYLIVEYYGGNGEKDTVIR